MTKTKRDRVLARRLKSVRILRSGMPGAPASNELHLSDRRLSHPRRDAPGARLVRVESGSLAAPRPGAPSARVECGRSITGTLRL